MHLSRSIVILDFGGQYAHLIASRVRRMGVYSEIFDADTPAENLKHAAGIILSGGPQSVYDPDSPQGDQGIFALGIPVLGICYGLHWMTKTLGGEVSEGKTKEYGPAEVRLVKEDSLFQGVGGGALGVGLQKESFTAWMSHGDEAEKLPDGFEQSGTSDACRNAAFEDAARNFYAFQFHPEVTHSEHGLEILEKFVRLCDADAWSISSYKDQVAEEIREEVGDRNVFMLVSGGVDSTVAFTLLNQVLGEDRVQGLLVDTGFMRKGEVEEIEDAFSKLGIKNLHIEDASEEFFSALEGITDPEEKRNVIGDTFLAVQSRVSEGVGGRALPARMNIRSDGGVGENCLLGQGTIYPDTIETGGTKHADKIKTHHNRNDAVQRMIDQGLVIEPLKDLYKDEVRMLGEELGLPHDLVWRHPFPGPGLGVRILCSEQLSAFRFPLSVPSTVLPVKSVGVQGDGRTYRHALVLFSNEPCIVSDEQKSIAVEVPNSSPEISRALLCTSQADQVDFVLTPNLTMTRDRADLLREADSIVTEEMRAADLYEKIWQFPVVLLPCGLESGGQSIVLRPITSTDAMTADAAEIPSNVLEEMTKRIMDLSGIDAVFFDLTSKPPGTIEWE